MTLDSALVDALRSARHVVLFTGAGVSAESGIPTFRDRLTGLWERFDAASLATAEAFRADPALTRRWSGAGTSGGAASSIAHGPIPRTWPSRRWPATCRRSR